MNQTLYNEAVASLGTDRAAAAALGVSASLLSLIRTGERRLTLDVARAVEQATAGRYLAADLLGLTRPDSEAA